MSAPTGPMDPERLASVRNTIGGYERKHVAPFLVELLAAHDHLADELIGVTRDRDSAAVGLRDARVEVERLRNVARGLAQAVVHRLPVTAYDLAAQVLEADARGAL